MTGVYNPKIFVLHAALRRQACAHCEQFPTAASRRSLGRVSVPVWPSALSGRLPIVALVSRYLTNKLIGRGSLFKRRVRRSPALIATQSKSGMSCGISPPFGRLSPARRQVTHAILTRLPLYSQPEGRFRVRLACIRHAASVDSEPGSNSQVKDAAFGPPSRTAVGQLQHGEPVMAPRCSV